MKAKVVIALDPDRLLLAKRRPAFRSVIRCSAKTHDRRGPKAAPTVAARDVFKARHHDTLSSNPSLQPSRCNVWGQ